MRKAKTMIYTQYQGKTIVTGNEKQEDIIKRLEKKIRLLEQIIDLAPVPLFAKDSQDDFRYLIWNKELEEFFKLSSDKIIGITDRELFTVPEESDYFRSYDESVMQGKSIVDIPCEEVRTTEGIKLAHTRKIPLYDEKGNPAILLGSLIDITNQVKTNEDLVNSKALLEEAQKISHMGHYIFDVGSGTWSCSPVLDEIFGIGPDFPKTTAGWELLIHPDFRKEMIRYLTEDVIRDGQVFDREYKILSYKGKNERWVHGYGKLHFGQSGETVTMFGIIQDITESKKTALELEEARRKAEESDRLKSAFLANMSHEIRTPLNGILGFSELLSEPDLSPSDKAEFVRIISESGNQLLRILNDIMDISKIETGQMELHFKEVSIAKILDEVIRFNSPACQSKGLALIRQPDTGKIPDFIQTDETRLRQILNNLLNNAIKFTDKGTVSIDVTQESTWLSISISDTGTGISKDNLKIIFERFRQVPDSQDVLAMGNGLGLPISKALLEAMGGEIFCESELHKGSRFTFRLPTGRI